MKEIWYTDSLKWVNGYISSPRPANMSIDVIDNNSLMFECREGGGGLPVRVDSK